MYEHIIDWVGRCLGVFIQYLQDFGLDSALQLTSNFRHFATTAQMNLDGNTLTNLEILTNGTDGKPHGSLLWLLSKTKTAFGARLVSHSRLSLIMFANLSLIGVLIVTKMGESALIESVRPFILPSSLLVLHLTLVIA
jgi:hypothetical protein